MGLTVIVPYWNGQEHLARLLPMLPPDLPVIVAVDACEPPSLNGLLDGRRAPTRVVRRRQRGWFGGAVNAGIDAVPETDDVLVLNQDSELTGRRWVGEVRGALERLDVTGEWVLNNPDYPRGYVHGSCLAISRRAIKRLGKLPTARYPHWGNTHLYQTTAARAGLKVGALPGIERWYRHAWKAPYGEATRGALEEARTPGGKARLLRQPPLVSVVIPVHNYGRYVDECLGSLMAQTEQDFEIVLVDDASSDESWDKLQEWAAPPYRWIRAYRNPVNLHVPATRNLGIHRARGKLILSLDIDDTLKPHALATFVAVHEANPDRWIYSDLECFGEKRGLRLMGDFDPAKVLRFNPSQATILFRKSWWRDAGGYLPQSAHGWDDYHFNIALAEAGHCGLRYPSRNDPQRCLVNYRVHKGQRNETSRRRQETLGRMIHELHPTAVRWEEEKADEMACCGRRARLAGGAVPGRRAPAPASRAASTGGNGAEAMAAPTPGGRCQKGLAEIQYVGRRVGKFSMRGTVSGTFYTVSLRRPRIWVCREDLPALVRLPEYREVARAAPPAPQRKVRREQDSVSAPTAAPRATEDVEEIEVETAPAAQDLSTPLAECVTNPRTVAALEAVGIDSIERAAAMSDDDLLALDGIGRATVRAIREFVAAQGVPA